MPRSATISPVADIRVHIDTLEYTRSGLKTKDPIPLQVGLHNRVVLVRPERVRPSGGLANVFAPSSAFPGAQVLASFLSAKAAASIGTIFAHLFGQEHVEHVGVFQIYGHADADGDEASNKQLSERRAEVFRALLVGDVDAFMSIAADESWGLREQQAMLRALQCDPGAIDGEWGPVTAAAVRDFQSDYVHGFFHQGTEASQRAPSLAVDGELQQTTADALLEALVVACSPRIEAARLHPTHPTAGCAAYNTLDPEQPSLNRRVTLVLHDPLPAHHDRAPCTDGDHSACPFDSRDRSGCLWFREHVADLSAASVQHTHWDLRWLALPNGKILLSALTTLPDDAEVRFRVFRSKAVEHPDEVGSDGLEEPLSDSLVGLTRLGVAQVVWEPDEGLDVFDTDAWFDGHDWDASVADPLAAWDAPNLVRVPVFKVTGGGADAISGPPARQAHQLRIDVDGAPPSVDRAWVVDSTGNFREVELDKDRPRTGATLRESARTILRLDVDGLAFTPREVDDE